MPGLMAVGHIVNQNWRYLFVYVEVLQPSQPNGVMSSMVSQSELEIFICLC